jgi:hypothetical protein
MTFLIKVLGLQSLQDSFSNTGWMVLFQWLFDLAAPLHLLPASKPHKDFFEL